MSNFSFLKAEESIIAITQNAMGSERSAITDPRSCCTYARVTLETAIKWMYAHDKDLVTPYDTNLNALLKDHTFKTEVPPHIQKNCELIRKVGNTAAHDPRPLKSTTSLFVVQSLHNLLFWFYRVYFDSTIQSKFDSSIIPDGKESESKREEAVKLEKELQGEIDERDKKILLMEQELERLKALTASNKQKAFATPDTHDYSEAETRKFLIDVLLREAGWILGTDSVTIEEEVTGVERNKSGKGKVDYVLWGDNGKPLAVVEAKKSSKDKDLGKAQALDYANALEKMYGQRPIIFYTNGYEHSIWDDAYYPPRDVQGFYKKDELERLISQRESRQALSPSNVNTAVAGRKYQKLAIQSVCEHFTTGHRKALLVMATGTGKTRTTIALTELLQKAGWAKRILFLCDRDALLTQAASAFTEHLPHTPAVDLRTAKDDNTSRLSLCTYGTMMGLIENVQDGERQLGVGHYDLIVIDEAHRSVYQKYSAIFRYFDSLLVGLTATPRSEADKDTYELFDLEKGVPVYAYELDEAVAQGWLVNFKKCDVSTPLTREGITYADLSEDEKREYEKHFSSGDEEDVIPDKISKKVLNDWLFNAPTVDSFLKNLMEHGLKVEGGDKIGKTIIFAKNKDHAKFIVQRFDKNYPEFKGKFCAQIDYSIGIKDVKTLIGKFKVKNGYPQIAVSVDMLDTGIDVPECVNLVFAKPVYSKTKFWQMIGRGTRLCENLYGPGQHKSQFFIFDYCNNFEFFEMKPEGRVVKAQQTLSEKIFNNHLKIVTKLQKTDSHQEVYKNSLLFLKNYVNQMNRDNFVVRPHLEYVDKYQKDDVWNNITKDKVTELTIHIAPLPSTMDCGKESEKRWDNIILNTQIELIENSPTSLKGEIRQVASCLADKKTIPMVEQNLELIQKVESEEFWEKVKPKDLEAVRENLRSLTHFVDKETQGIVYTNFEDKVDVKTEMTAYELGSTDMAQYRKKMEALLRDNENHITISKIKKRMPLTPSDLNELDRMLFDCKYDNRSRFEKIFGAKVEERLQIETPSLSTLIRSIIGLDKGAVEQEFSQFIDATDYTTQQYHFVSQVIEFYVRDGFVSPSSLYEPPFSDIHDGGPDELFDEDSADKLFDIIESVNSVAG